MASRKVTMADIARESGASPTTVSLVLRGRPGISDDTRSRVMSVARDLDYKPRSRQVIQADGATRSIAALFRVRSRTSEDRTFTLNPFYSWVLSGMEATARQHQLNLLYGTIAVDHGNTVIDMPRHLLGQRLDGIVIIGALTAAQAGAIAGSSNAPIVLVDGPAVPGPYDVIASDNCGGMRRLIQYVQDAGHRNIAFVTCGPDDNPNFAERERGYSIAMREAGLEPRIERFSGDKVEPVVNALLDAASPPTAIAAANDSFALVVWNACIARGITVPDYISIVGFDDIELAGTREPGLTTMHVDKVSMGRQALSMLEYRRQWPDAAPGCLILSPRLVRRGSVASPSPNATAPQVSPHRPVFLTGQEAV